MKKILYNKKYSGIFLAIVVAGVFVAISFIMLLIETKNDKDNEELTFLQTHTKRKGFD